MKKHKPSTARRSNSRLPPCGKKRGELRLCRRIQADIPRVSQQCQQAQAERQKNLKKKEEHEHEYQR